MSQRVRRTPEKSRQLILDAAEAVVREVGPGGLRVADVARRAEMTHPNLLHHFGTREGLMAALTERLLARATTRVLTGAGEIASAPTSERTARVVELLEELDGDGDGRLLAWLALSGRVQPGGWPSAEPLVDVAHGLSSDRVSRQGTKHMMLLLVFAVLGQATASDVVLPVFGMNSDDDVDGYRKWLAEFLFSLSRGLVPHDET